MECCLRARETGIKHALCLRPGCRQLQAPRRLREAQHAYRLVPRFHPRLTQPSCVACLAISGARGLGERYNLRLTAGRHGAGTKSPAAARVGIRRGTMCSRHRHHRRDRSRLVSAGVPVGEAACLGRPLQRSAGAAWWRRVMTAHVHDRSRAPVVLSASAAAGRESTGRGAWRRPRDQSVAIVAAAGPALRCRAPHGPWGRRLSRSWRRRRAIPQGTLRAFRGLVATVKAQLAPLG